MDIDEFIENQKSYEVGTVSSKVDITDITMSEMFWTNYLASNPQMAEAAAVFSDLSKEEMKSIVNIMDRLIQDNAYGLSMSDDEIDDLRLYRQEMIEKIKQA